MEFRMARAEDLDGIIALVQERIDWMDEVGLEQWTKTDYFGRFPREYFEANLPWFVVAEENGVLAAAAAFYEEDDYWPREGEPAVYIHHLASSLACKGAGRALMEYADVYARERGIHLLRLDSAVDNLVLERFYTDLGYRAVGTCQGGLYRGIKREKCI